MNESEAGRLSDADELGPPVRLDRSLHQLDGLDCGEPSLNSWLAHSAGQAERRSATRTYVLAGDDGRVVGYVTLAAAQVAPQDATASVRRGLPTHFPVPVALIARLAVDRSIQGTDRGAQLVNFALERCLVASAAIGIRAVVVDAIVARAAGFYQRFGFEPLPENPLRLMVEIGTLRKAFAESSLWTG